MTPAKDNRTLAFAVVRMALDAMRANKMRSALTVTGVIIGVSTVIAMAAILQGLDGTMAKQFRLFGSHVMWIRPFRMSGPNFGGIPDSLRQRHGFTEGDREAILEYCPAVKAISPLRSMDSPMISYRNQKARRTDCFGVNDDYLQISGLGLLRGRNFTAQEVEHSSAVVLLGQDAQESLFPHGSSVGKTVHVGGIPFVVVGELASRGKMFGQSQDNVVMIPHTALQKFFGGQSQEQQRLGEFNMKAKAVSDERTAEAMDQMTEILRRRRGLRANQPENFVIETDEAMLNLYHQMTGAIYLVMMAISSIALLVGGIGVMNIMLITVKERTREIGVRKALGARQRDILNQFVLEAVTLTGVGGVIGIGLGVGLSGLVAVATPLPAAVAPWSILAGLILSTGTGLFFGIYPAYRASRLDPIEALRYE